MRENGISFIICLSICLLWTSCTRKASLVLPENILNVRIDVSNMDGTHGPCEPSIAISPTQPKHMVAGAVLNYAYHSEDGGYTWKKQVLHSTHGVYGDPVILADYKGNFYYAHLSDPSGKRWADERLLDRMVVQKSSDNGRTWNNGSHTEVRHPKDQDKEWLAVDARTGSLYMTWTEFDDYGSADPAHKFTHSIFEIRR